MRSVSTITGMVSETWLLEKFGLSSGFELFTAISILMGLAFDSSDTLSLATLPTTSGRMIVLREI